MALQILPPAGFAQLRELALPLDHLLVVTAILAGETPAQVYVDDRDAPSLALLIHWDGHRAYVLGETHASDLLQEIRETLFAFFASQGRQADKHAFALYYASPVWETSFQTVYAGVEIRSAERQYYELSAMPAQPQTPLPMTWRMRTIDASLLAEQDLEYLPKLIEEIHSESPSPEDFFSRKFGFCLQDDRRLIGWCLSEYNHTDRCEVGIETVAAYRQRGVAYRTASALIAEALSRGITTIGWHCWRANVASGALARQLGGVLTKEYSVALCRYVMSQDSE
jgi:RimJ/RimL family protein N-acetyltransferase